MTTVTVTLAAILLSVAGIALLTVTDPKRRRVSGMPEAKRRPAALASVVIFAPGIALLTAGQSAAFVMWLAAVPLAGWALTILPPGAMTRAGRSLKAAARSRFHRSSSKAG